MAGIFGFFDYTKPGKGVSKDAPKKKGVALYFHILLKRFWKFITLNLIYLIASIPAILISWFISTYFVTWLAVQAQINIGEAVTTLNLLSVLVTIVFLHMWGSGPATAALTYVLRKYANDTHAWVWSDFKDSFKSNFKQGIIVYLINTAVFSLLFLAFLFYSYMQSATVFLALRSVVLVMLALFYMMQTYVYQMIAGFELKLKYVYRNAFLLTTIALPKNILTGVVVGAIIYAIFSLSLRMPLAGILVIGLLMYTLLSFTQIFMTNNTVKKHMLQSSANQDTDKAEDFDSDFEDA